ncbi:HAD family hydrolase [Saccharopolyspora sp. CA-218241]|uniref:HAD family hydrolase n=1 Tax=Saccharopolyspora sp. CA-218241 TaxID=3240027 RepID=UPI003D972C8D
MSTDAVLFDFSGTLFRLEETAWSLGGFTDSGGEPFDVAAQAEIMRRMTAPSGQVVELEPEYVEAWERRDLDPVLHRKVYLEVLRRSGLTVREQAEELYGRLIDPGCWTPYPDTAGVLRGLRAAGVPVAVISNIAFDIRPAFTELGVAEDVDEFLLSFEEGMIKPDPAVFRLACERLGVAPERALMIGDSEEADGGAAALGCRVELVQPLPTDERPDALRAAVAGLLA